MTPAHPRESGSLLQGLRRRENQEPNDEQDEEDLLHDPPPIKSDAVPTLIKKVALSGT